MSPPTSQFCRPLLLESFSSRAPLFVLLGLLTSLGGQAQVWDGGGSNRNWDTANNWNPNATPGSNDTVTFDADNANGRHEISLNGTNRVMESIVFTDSTSDIAFDFLTKQMRIKAGGLINNDQVDQRFQTVRLNEDQSWDLSAGGGVLIDNNLVFIRSLTIDGTGAVDIDNRLQINNANRTLTINTTGGFTTDILRINTANFTIAGAGDFTVDETLQNHGNDRLFTNNNTGDVTINDVSLSNNTTNRTLTVGGSGTTTVNGVVSDGGSTASNLTKTDAGQLILNGSNTYNGTTTIDGGTVIIANDTALGTTTGDTTVAAGASLILTNDISVGAEALTLSGTANLDNLSGTNSYAGVISGTGQVTTTAGQLTLSGANTFSGDITIAAGSTLVASHDDALGSGGGATTVQSGGTLELTGGVTIDSETNISLSGVGVSASGALLSTAGANTVSDSISISANSEIQIDAGSTLAIDGNITGSGQTLTVETTGNATFSGSNTLGALDKNDSGQLTVTGTNTYATANINGGTFALGNSNILANTMDVNIDTSGTFAVGTFAETIDDLNGSGTLTIASGGQLDVDKIGNAGAFTGDLNIDGVMTLNGGLIGSGADGSASTGTLQLNASNTLEIAADFSFGGTLELAANTSLYLTGNNTTFTLDTLHITGDTVIDFSGVDTTTFNIGTLIIDAGVAVSAIGWESFNDLWTAANFSGATLDESNSTTAQITFGGFNASDTIWLAFDYGANEITVPEPRTYGALLIGGALIGYLMRRRPRAISRDC